VRKREGVGVEEGEVTGASAAGTEAMGSGGLGLRRLVRRCAFWRVAAMRGFSWAAPRLGLDEGRGFCSMAGGKHAGR
jgi:hypothetical protein